MVIPPHENSVTHIKAPDSAIINTLQKWLAEKNWAKLIPAIELNFLDEDSGFKYWLTAQRYVAMALDQVGGPAQGAAEEILFQTARLLQRVPNLSQLKFENKLAFADDETLQWIEEQVASRLGSGSGKDMILPPILGEEYETITEDYKKICSELPDNFEINMENLEKSLAGETRRKGRFLRMLNLANFCFQAKKFELAKVHLTKLLEKIEAYQLAEWEPALCTGVWESMFLVNLKLLTFEKEPARVVSIESQQEDLFKKIALYNGVLALRLASRTQNKGE
jgi:type VI secretion system protein VasJ